LSINTYFQKNKTNVAIVVVIISLLLASFLSYKIIRGHLLLSQGILQLEAGEKKYKAANGDLLLHVGNALFAGGQGFKTAELKILDGKKRIFRGKLKLLFAKLVLILLVFNSAGFGYIYLIRNRS